MSAFEPNPPTRKAGGFPKTTTIPEGWMTDHMSSDKAPLRDEVTGQVILDPAQAVPVTAAHANGRANGRSNGHSHPAETPADENESPFARRLDPFPSEADLNGSWL